MFMFSGVEEDIMALGAYSIFPLGDSHMKVAGMLVVSLRV